MGRQALALEYDLSTHFRRGLSLGGFVYRVTQALFKWLNRRSQRKSYNWEGFKELVKHFGIVKPRICHAF
jgi:hypothetical protein